MRCGDFLNVLQGKLRDYVFREGDGTGNVGEG